MRKLTIVCTLLLIMHTIGCAGISVSYDYDERADFAQMKSFDWLPAPTTVEVSELQFKRFKDAVTTHMEGKGLQLSSDNPDFLIAFHYGKKDKINVNDWGYGYGYRGWGGGSIYVDQYEEGTVILDFVNAQTRVLFWRGEARLRLQENSSPGKERKRAQKIAEEILKNFPPAQ